MSAQKRPASCAPRLLTFGFTVQMREGRSSVRISSKARDPGTHQ
jgi:hypothetical protein